MLKILFPFFNKNRHAFLKNKWWFRAFTVIFFVALILSITTIWFSEVQEVYDDCIAYYGNKIILEEVLSCNQNARDAWTYPGIIQASLINPIIYFYLIQLFIFKVVIDYIILGGKK